jgi:hypothetical protein
MGVAGHFVIGATSPAPSSGWVQNLSEAIIPRYRRLAEAGHRHGLKLLELVEKVRNWDRISLWNDPPIPAI